MFCIICNENPERDWPKRWQCWKDNGKFSESLCKLLGLPTFPYKTDFQNSMYCSPCQKRVYNVYLMMRKWDKLQDEISKLKSRLRKDFEESLHKSDNSSSSEDYEKSNSSNSEGKRESEEKSRSCSGESGADSLATFAEINTVVRRRILKRLDKGSWDCDCCCDTSDEGHANHSSAPVQKGNSHCGFPNCKDKDCLLKRSENAERPNEKDEDGESSSSGSEWSSHQESECDYELCSLCCSSDGHLGKKKEEHGAIHEAPCSSEFCSDCSICKHEAKRSKDMINTNKRVKSWTATCGENPNPTMVKTEVDNSQSPRDTERSEFMEESTGSDLNFFIKNNIQRSKEKCCVRSTVTPTRFQSKKESSHQETTASTETQDDGEDGTSGVELKYDNTERFRCFKSNCTRTFLSQEDLDIHVKRHHDGIKCPFVCQQCGRSFQWRRELTSHVLKHTGEVAICCHLCGRGFRTKQLFNVHLKTKHGGERKFKCSMCDKSFISESKLNTHLTIHTKVYPFACTICGKGFSAKTFLSFHMSKHMEANPYQCTTCSKTFSSPRNLKVHQYTHTNSHPFKCTICQAGTTSETLLKKHMLKHNTEKGNACLTCHKKFRFPSSLKKHQKVHSGEKQFKCEFCSKTFVDKYKLTRHLRTHSGDKPFFCTTCKQSFATKEYLNKHNLQSHKSEPASDNHVSSGSLDPSMELSPIHSDDLQLPEIDDPLSAYLPDGFPHDPSFLDHINNVDEDMVVTAFDLEKFSKEELMMNKEPGDLRLKQENKDSTNLVPSTTILPDFQSLRRNSDQFGDDFSSFPFH